MFLINNIFRLIWIVLLFGETVAFAEFGWNSPVIQAMARAIDWLQFQFNWYQGSIDWLIGLLIVLGCLGWALKPRKSRKRITHKRATVSRKNPREKISPVKFERQCADTLRRKGWKTGTTQISGDQGADVVARKSGRLLVIQCKLHSAPIGNKAVQEALAAKAYMRASHAAVVSNQRYTSSAQRLAYRTGVFLIHFNDLNKLTGKIKR